MRDISVLVFCAECETEAPTVGMRQLLEPEEQNQPALLLASGQALEWQCPNCGKKYDIEMEFSEVKSERTGS